MKMISSILQNVKIAFIHSFLDRKSFAFWGLLTLFLNFILLHGQGFSSDLEFWRNWIKTLQNGFGGFSGDYPPFYVLWLRVVAWFYNVTGLSLDLDYELKQYCLFPVILAHISLVHFAWLRLQKRSWEPMVKTVVMILVAVNPVFYLDGPVWGQVDVLPVTICIWALWYAARPKTFALGMGLFMLGLLTKFQMIMFLPVFGAIALRYRKIMWQGLLSAAIVFGLVFLPFILTGNFVGEFSHAYLSSVGQYPYAAMNAGNLWMAIAGNFTPDVRPLIEGAPAFLSPSVLGKVLFVLVSLCVLAVTFLKRLPVARLMQLASLNGLAFFMILPCMHERYVLAAAAMCIAGVTCQKTPRIHGALVLSGIAFVNISMMMSLRGEGLWFWISIAGILSMVYFFMATLCPNRFSKACGIIQRIPMPGIIVYGMMLLIYAVDMGHTFAQVAKSAYKLDEGEVFVYELTAVTQIQGYGNTHIGKSIDGNPLRLKGELYLAGIGTHSPSNHTYLLPENATRFTAGCGVDDESGNGTLECVVALDGNVVWRSGALEGRQVANIDLDIRGAKSISLITDELGSKHFDHADWVNPVIHTK